MSERPEDAHCIILSNLLTIIPLNLRKLLQLGIKRTPRNLYRSIPSFSPFVSVTVALKAHKIKISKVLQLIFF